MESYGGMMDEAFVEIEGHAEREAARTAERQRVIDEIIASVPPCPHCGGSRTPVAKWTGDGRPPVKCSNPECPRPHPRIWRPESW